ncbi:MAG: AAA family ATPase [Solirubrobacterales bacterium]|nr:AAA family ATPase [Solirubrobacterales bacterium]
MHLKSITLKGFKSFPDRTVLDFLPGVSVIVGPNGSGKSNITDAVLWALGEQSPVAVRGQSMQDVIFAGAPGRQSAGRAEVELVLDDSEGSLGLGTPEISILRRLDRAGEGEYRLAGARCRLVDVIELLSDTGLGKEMHSVISQGRVESIVTSKPRDRRALVEEAAGLGKHRKRRRRTELKLERTQHNLDRALDVEREARGRLRPLKRQAEAAELHARLERQTLEARLELVREEVRERREDLETREREVAALRGGRGNVEGELDAVAGRRQGAERALTARSARREELSRRCFVARTAAERVADRSEVLAVAAAASEARIARGRERLDALRRQAAVDTGEVELEERIAALEAELERARRERETELAREVEELERQRARAEAALRDRGAAVARTLSARELAEQRAEEAHAAVAESARVVDRARLEAARVGSELHSVNRLLRGHELGAGSAPTVADELAVEEGYELALAVALDGRLRAAVARDLPSAQLLLDSGAPDGGRVLVPGEVADAPARGSPPGPEAHLLAEHVRGDGEAAAVVRALLRDTWIVESVERLPVGFTGIAVTRSGRAWSGRDGELRQAPAVGDDQVLARRNRREQLLRATERTAAGEQAARGAHERGVAELSKREAGVEGARSAHRAALRARDEAVEETRRLEQLVDRRRRTAAGEANDRAERLAAELAAHRRLHERSAHDRERRDATVALLDSIVAEEQRCLPAAREAVAALRESAEAIAVQGRRFERELTDDRQAAEEIAGELRDCAQREAALQAELHRVGEALTGAEVGAQRARDQMREAAAELSELAGRLQLQADPRPEPLPLQEREALAQRLERLARRRAQLGPVNPLAAAEYGEAVAHVEELEHQREDLETALRELEKLIRDTDRQIEECFERTFAATARNFDDVVGRLFPGGAGRLRLVAERKAPVTALGGQPLASGQREGDGAQIAKDDLDDAPQEAEALGIEIEIMPAGKRMQRLSLLSGGEKSLTALAFLFAVFLARPCPFYILDEVEAALDDLNLDRFLDLLRSYSGRAQFIVVTHQKRTMEAADSLYGVVMGGDGISKVVSRRLPAAEASAP